MMIFDDDVNARLLRKAAEVYGLNQVCQPKAGARLDVEALTGIDREIMRELRAVARTRRDRWVSFRSMHTVTKRIRSAWRLAEAQGLRNWGEKFQFARSLVAERIEALAQAGRIHSEVHYTPSGLERPGFVISMFDCTLTPADGELLAAMHVRW